MDLFGVSVALFGRFRTRPRSAFAALVEARGGRVTRELTRASRILVVGHGAAGTQDQARLEPQLERAAEASLATWGEEAFWELCHGRSPDAAPVPLARLGVGLGADELHRLALFDLIVVDGDQCRFADVDTIRTADRLVADGRPLAAAIETLLRAKGAPRGRRRLVPGPAGEAVLEWDDGLTDLDGQGLLPLDRDSVPSVDELFEQASEAEDDGDAEAAERLYAACVRADRRDPIAPFNLANLQCARGAHEEAVLHYRLAIARDTAFAEAHYNLASALEALEDMDGSEKALSQAVELDADYGDALFNLAQLKLRREAVVEARALFERYLAGDPPDEWAAKARRALNLIALHKASPKRAPFAKNG